MAPTNSQFSLSTGKTNRENENLDMKDNIFLIVKVSFIFFGFLLINLDKDIE